MNAQQEYNYLVEEHQGKETVLALPKETLEKYPRSLFALLVANTRMAFQKDIGENKMAYVIEKPLPLVQRIVEYMNSPRKFLLTEITFFLQELKNEASYLGIDDLVRLVDQKTALCPPPTETTWPPTDGMFVVYSDLAKSAWALKIVFSKDSVSVHKSGKPVATGGIYHILNPNQIEFETSGKLLGAKFTFVKWPGKDLYFVYVENRHGKDFIAEAFFIPVEQLMSWNVPEETNMFRRS